PAGWPPSRLPRIRRSSFVTRHSPDLVDEELDRAHEAVVQRDPRAPAQLVLDQAVVEAAAALLARLRLAVALLGVGLGQGVDLAEDRVDVGLDAGADVVGADPLRRQGAPVGVDD